MSKTEQFLKSLYDSIIKRADSYLELAMSLASTNYLESVVALSEIPIYRRRFSSIYESLKKVLINEERLLIANLEMLSKECQLLGGYEIYSGDGTFIKRAEAKTMPERVMKRLPTGELVYGHETYWTTRLADPENSWTGVALVNRMGVNGTVTTMAAKHMLEIDAKSKTKKDKFFVFDAGHSVDILAAQINCQNSDIIKRVKSDQVFYYQPKYRGIGRPAKYGEKIKLNSFAKEANQELIVKHKNKTLRITSWQGLQARSYMNIPLTILKLEFLDHDSNPIFKRPVWLITTAIDVNPETIARAYLWRASHELTFRFMKQHLGLLKNQSSDLVNCDNWYQLVALAMNILLVIKDDLSSKPKPWYPIPINKTISQRQAQKQALVFLLGLPGTTNPPRPAGKAYGRPKGYYPPPRKRHKVNRKTPYRPKKCPNCGFSKAL